MYAIGYVIYGVPINERISNLIDRWEEDESSPWFESESGLCGFETVYSGAGHQHVGWCGVKLCELDECDDPATDVGKLKLEPTEKQKKTAESKLEKLHPDIRILCNPVKVWIVWGTS